MSDFFILQITFFHLLPPAAKSENHTNNRENLQGEKEELVAQSHVKYIKTNKQKNQDNRKISYPSSFCTDNIKHFQKFPLF